MISIKSDVLESTIEISRIIGHIKGSRPGPTIVFTAGIHGNEPSGIFALNKVLNELQSNHFNLAGNIYGISGNMYALEKGLRYDKMDLNRLWTNKRMKEVVEGRSSPQNQDIIEQLEIYEVLQNILHTEEGPFYFMDLHTTSSKSIPFLTVNDSLLNRWFTSQYPLPIILGIEEYLDGPVLSYINELGYVSFGYEAGQHDDLSSYENQVAFIYTSLVLAGCLSKNEIDYRHYHNVLAKTSVGSNGVYEILYKYDIQKDEQFKMKPGFVNFQAIHKKQLLATSNKGDVLSKYNDRIFMPLYQAQGDDGFYIIRSVRNIFLKLSEILRKIKFDKILTLLPGIRREVNQQETLVINLKIAKFFAKQFFHLLGYRNKIKDKTHLIVKNREVAARNEDYAHQPWYKG